MVAGLVADQVKQALEDEKNKTKAEIIKQKEDLDLKIKSGEVQIIRGITCCGIRCKADHAGRSCMKCGKPFDTRHNQKWHSGHVCYKRITGKSTKNHGGGGLPFSTSYTYVKTHVRGACKID